MDVFDEKARNLWRRVSENSWHVAATRIQHGVGVHAILVGDWEFVGGIEEWKRVVKEGNKYPWQR